MSLADLTRKGSLQRIATATVATPATQLSQNARTVATVACVAVANGPDSKSETGVAVQSVATVAAANGSDCRAANDAEAELSVARIAFANPPDSKLAPGNTVVTVKISSGAPDPDRWCWPHSDAMTGAEIVTFTGRLVLFTAKGLTPNDADVLADKLLARDRESDDRYVCLECIHMHGRADHQQCLRLQFAGMSGPMVAAGQVAQLQRCDGFEGAPA